MVFYLAFAVLLSALYVALQLALPLLVTRILADHANHPVAADDLALPTNLANRRSYFHFRTP